MCVESTQVRYCSTGQCRRVMLDAPGLRVKAPASHKDRRNTTREHLRAADASLLGAVKWRGQRWSSLARGSGGWAGLCGANELRDTDSVLRVGDPTIDPTLRILWTCFVIVIVIGVEEERVPRECCEPRRAHGGKAVGFRPVWGPGSG